MRIFTAFVLLLSVLAIVNTQSQMMVVSVETNLTVCKDKDDKTDKGVIYKVKCGSCSNVTTTVTSSTDNKTIQVVGNSACSNCNSGKPTSNKTCTFTGNLNGTIDQENDVAFLSNCFDYTSTCSTNILSMPRIVLLLALGTALLTHH